jgi:nucleoid-associated protein YgaU
MAKPNSQTGHGSFGGTEDESSLAHGEASRGDTEAEGGSEADWDIPAAPDNSSLSRILGLVLIVVLAGVFSFVAYRKYDEARRNPTAGQPVAETTTGNTSPADSNAEPSTTSAAGQKDAFGQGNSSDGRHSNAPSPAASFAQNRPASADAFGSLDNRGPGRSENGFAQNAQHGHQPAAVVGLTEAHAAPNASPAGAREPDANPFGDLNGAAERPTQPPPAQSEPPQQLAGSTSASGSPISAIPTGGARRGGAEPHASSAATADAEMQNLFPNEGTPKPDRSPQNPQNLAPRGTPLEPAGMTRTAQLQDQPAQVQAGRTPPPQSEPLDNELLDESHSPAHQAAGERGAPAGVQAKGRAEALMAGKEGMAGGEESLFGNSQPSARPSQHPISQSSAQPHSTLSPLQGAGTTSGLGGDVHSPAASDDPFAGNRSSAGGRFADRSGAPPTGDSAFSPSGRSATGAGSATAVGTTSDAGDYYVVQPQDNFWTISRKKYGTSRYFQALAELNKARIPDAGRMRPGMKVSTPPAEMLEERYGQFLPPGTRVQVTAAEDALAKVAPTGFFVSPDGTPKYRTGQKDTLSDIAAKHLGRSSRYIQIYEMNRDKLSSPNQLKVGTELILPGDASSIGMSNDDDDRR